MSVMIIGSLIYKNKKINKEVIINTVILLVPAVTTVATTIVLCFINYVHYGVYTLRNDEYYNKAMAAISSVQAEEKIDKVTNTREKMNRIAEVTILSNIMPEFNELADAYSKIDGNQEDDEVEDGWFGWCLTDAVNATEGYDTIEASNNFYNTLAIQIEEAIENGTLEKSTKKINIGELIADMYTSIKDCIVYILKYSDLEFDAANTARTYRVGMETTAQRYEEIAKNKFLYAEDSEKVEGEDVTDFEAQEEYLESLELQENIASVIVNIYRVINAIFIVGGFAVYIVCTVKMIKKKKLLENWVIMSGLLGAIACVIVVIAYTTVKYFSAISSFYLMAVYPLIMVLGIVSIMEVKEWKLNKIKR